MTKATLKTSFLMSCHANTGRRGVVKQHCLQPLLSNAVGEATLVSSTAQALHHHCQCTEYIIIITAVHPT
jgi:hypothetical protein